MRAPQGRLCRFDKLLPQSAFQGGDENTRDGVCEEPVVDPMTGEAQDETQVFAHKATASVAREPALVPIDRSFLLRSKKFQYAYARDRCELSSPALKKKWVILERFEETASESEFGEVMVNRFRCGSPRAG